MPARSRSTGSGLTREFLCPPWMSHCPPIRKLRRGTPTGVDEVRDTSEGGQGPGGLHELACQSVIDIGAPRNRQRRRQNIAYRDE
ncbi:MAG TPA: hypothetical protein VF819_02700, partial [Nitrospira sp.]